MTIAINILIYLLILIVLIFGFIIWRRQRRLSSNLPIAENLTASDVPKWKASADYLISQEDWEAVNGKYFTANTKYQAMPVPGLQGAWSIDQKLDQAFFSTNWVPQSVALTDKYVIVGAYDGNYRLNSLLFVIDKESGAYQKSIILPNKTHLGGLSFDPATKNIWFSNDYRGTARLSVINQKTIDQYDAEISQKAINVDYSIDLPFIRATSAVALFEDTIFILIFDRRKKSAILGFPLVDGYIDSSRLPKKKINTNAIDKITEQLQESGAADYMSISTGFKRMQGVGIFKNIALFSSSFGNVNSELIWAKKEPQAINKTIGKGGGFVFKRLATMKLPPYLEQINISTSDNKLIMLFESGASKYRVKTSYIMDRLLIVDINYQSMVDAAKDSNPSSFFLGKSDSFSSGFK